MRTFAGEVKTVVVDFDGVIRNHTKGKDDLLEQTPLIEGTKEALAKLKAAGFYIIISTARDESQREFVTNTLLDNGLAHDEIQIGTKPRAYYYIDDRGIRFESWKDTLKLISEDFPEVKDAEGNSEAIQPEEAEK